MAKVEKEMGTKLVVVSLITDVDGSISSKRIITFACIIAILITWYCNLFYKLPIEEFIFQGLMYITGIGLGVITAEKFSRKGYGRNNSYTSDDSSTSDTEEPEPDCTTSKTDDPL